MNKRIDFTNLGGSPIDQDSLAFMQSSYRDALAGIAGLCGDKTILTGVVITGSNASAGWISYNGELIPFIGGATSTDVVIQETASAMTFEDNGVHDVEFTKVARFGTPGDFPFSDLNRLNTLKEMWLKYDVKEVDCPAQYIIDNFDNTGLGINERKGWAICNGSNGTKKRDGRVSVGYSTVTIDPADSVWDVAYNTIGAAGGEKKHTLTNAEVPAKSINLFKDRKGGDAGADVISASTTDLGHGNYTLQVGGSGQSHENRQPFIVTLFIQKL